MIGRRALVGRRGRGVVRGVARTAVVAGTATAATYAVGSRIQKRQAAKDDQQMAAAGEDPQGAGPEDSYQTEQAPSAPEGGSDLSEQLQQLAQLKDSGALTDDEFVAAKAKLLAQ